MSWTKERAMKKDCRREFRAERKAGERSDATGQVIVARDALILAGRGAARKMAGKLLKAWNAHLPEDEVESLCSLALCEAATRFRPEKGAQFLTYLYFYIRGYLIREFDSRANAGISWDFERGSSVARNGTVSSGNNENAVDHTALALVDGNNPEKEAAERAIRRIVFAAMQELEVLEQKIILEVFYGDMKVAKVARKLGFSRGYLSDVKTSALKKLRGRLVVLKEAA